ncbi:MAG: diguanylate cyclase [Sulfuricaulis sp.]|nr:diguanylate cyclase [Sulfuricaulis sp.]
METAQPAAARAALARYEALFPTHAGRIARIVALIEKHLGAEVRAAVRTYGLIFALAMLLAVVAVILVRRQSTLPLYRLIEATRSIAAGAYDRRVTVSSRDEIGELAGTFNRMAEAVGEKTSRIAALNEIAVQLTTLHSLHELLDEIMRRGMQLTGAQAACIAFYSQEAQRFGQWITQGLSDRFVENMNFRPGGLADEAFIAGTYILSNDRPETKHKLSRLTHEEGIQSFICMPLTSHASRLGVIYFYRKDRDFFLPDEIEILATFAHLAAGAIESARLQEQMHDLAMTDKLTGLRNRRLFDERLTEEIQRAARDARPISLLMLDIDDFKRVNDIHGHVAGDQVLQALGKNLSEQLWRVDLVARYGGEEFAVILPATDFVGAKVVAERIRRSIAGLSVRLPDRHEITVTVTLASPVFRAAETRRRNWSGMPIRRCTPPSRKARTGYACIARFSRRNSSKNPTASWICSTRAWRTSSLL